MIDAVRLVALGLFVAAAVGLGALILLAVIWALLG